MDSTQKCEGMLTLKKASELARIGRTWCAMTRATPSGGHHSIVNSQHGMCIVLCRREMVKKDFSFLQLECYI